IGGHHWRLAPHNLEATGVPGIPFTCISYVWGKEREESPFHPSFQISSRTIPSLTAVTLHLPSRTHFWVDALCVPVDDILARNETLQSMGFIYSVAEEVVAILSKDTYPILKQMNETDRLDTAHLDILEKEEWVVRAWTYQEAVNSRRLFLTCEGSDGALVDGSNFLNRLGYTLSRVEVGGLTKKNYPRLDAFEDLIADYMLSAYQERSALQVIANMDRRAHEYPQDRFFAMMSAISSTSSSFRGTLDPCEAFMAMCEQKGDYSFIYTAAERDTAPGRGWRPATGGSLPAIIPWHSWGEGQPAHKDGEDFYLDSVVVFRPQELQAIGKEFITKWLAASKMTFPDASPEVTIPMALQAMGYKGSTEGISTSHGLFFPFKQVEGDKEIEIIVATKVRWTFGAPGLVRIQETSMTRYEPGVFFGRI
ncbi:hypothetical protein CPC08DRAFT_589508, partial [Agrocybe pediades]